MPIIDCPDGPKGDAIRRAHSLRRKELKVESLRDELEDLAIRSVKFTGRGNNPPKAGEPFNPYIEFGLWRNDVTRELSDIGRQLAEVRDD